MDSEGWLDRAKVHTAMILGGAGYGGYNVLTKASLSGGVDPFVFSTYRDGIGCITLFLYALYYERHHWRKVSLEVAGVILAMAFVGVYSQQALFLYGLQYTNVVFASLVTNCIPVWAFLISAIFGIEEVAFYRRDGKAKVLGILLCVSGATILTLQYLEIQRPCVRFLVLQCPLVLSSQFCKGGRSINGGLVHCA